MSTSRRPAPEPEAPVPTPVDGRREPDHMALFERMLLVRRFEERCVELYSAGRIRGFLHLYIGEEAVAVGALDHLRDDDAVVATYRDHGQALARGVPVGPVMAEMLGRAEGVCRGRGGSMHLFHAPTRFYGGNGIVGGGLPLAVGLALADRMQGRDRVTVCFFGEGAMAEGEFHESMNLAALWHLPVLFLCENNLALKAASYEVPAWSCDGMDVLATWEAARRAVELVRDGGSPVFLEAKTYRFRAHSMYDADRYRDRAEIEHWRERDPLVLLRTRLLADGVPQKDLDAAETRVTAALDDAVAFAEAGTEEPVDELLTFVTSGR